MNLTQEILREHLDYNPETGVFIRKKSGWKKCIGKVAGTTDTSGHLQIKIDGRLYLAHRLAWLWVYGEWPELGIDHRDGNKQHNAIGNLRKATQLQNMQNQFHPHQGRSTTLLGAHWQKKEGKWRAQIRADGRNVYLGSFDTDVEAHAAYMAAKRDLHPFAEIAK